MEKTVTDYLRAFVKLQAGDTDPATLKLTEWDYEFEQLMRNRLLLGVLRFGNLRKNNRKGNHTKMIIKYFREKLNEYEQTGNIEMLVDLANFCMIESIHSDHPKRHFKSIDRED
jgi:hypothetical protein